jgi:hypothetical protein
VVVKLVERIQSASGSEIVPGTGEVARFTVELLAV